MLLLHKEDMKHILSVIFLIIDILFPISDGKTGAVSTTPDVTTTKIELWDQHSKGRGKVRFTAYEPSEKTSDAAVIICPGGSYFWLDNKNEGEKMALELASHGITAFVLNYRVAGKFNFITDLRVLYDGNRFPRMLEDLQKAICHVRSNAATYKINPNKIGAMGFSAGGHLVMLSAESETLPEGIEGYHHPGAQAMPDFVAPIYPVVTMSDNEIVHKRSRRALLGIHRTDAELRDRLSLEKNVPRDCCPVFLLNCVDDPVVDYRNSEELDKALSSNGVKHKYIQLKTGGHGFGANPVASPDGAYNWTGEFYRWLSDL